MTTTESPFLKSINDFCNKICQKRTHAPQKRARVLLEMKPKGPLN
jgi:hypothetical protein